MHKLLTSKWTKACAFLICLLPLAVLGWRGLHNGLTANPIEFITHATGDWTLRFILFSLCVTPFRKLLGLPDLIRFRRMLGLFAFFYGCLHFTTYIWLDKFFDLKEVWKDISKRPYITVGFLAFVLLIPLAITSTAGWIRRLGGRRWRLLHCAIYISAVAGVIHYYWLVKSAVIRPLTYGAILAALLLWRLFEKFSGAAGGGRGKPAETPARDSSLRQIVANALKHGGIHRFRDASRLRILLARMVNAKKPW